jgi:hypothetical protein
MAKSRPKVSVKGFFKCPHCDLVVDFPVGYCTICGLHTHELFMGAMDKVPHPGICRSCFRGETKAGQEWHRKNKTWRPNPDTNAWDEPEWYDGAEEWKSSTLMEAWIPDVNTIEEL